MASHLQIVQKEKRRFPMMSKSRKSSKSSKSVKARKAPSRARIATKGSSTTVRRATLSSARGRKVTATVLTKSKAKSGVKAKSGRSTKSAKSITPRAKRMVSRVKRAISSAMASR